MTRAATIFIGIALFFIFSSNLWAMDLFAAKLTPMRMDADQFRAWVDRHQKAPKAHMDPDIAKWLSDAQSNGVSTSMDLLQYLSYVPSERQQGKCGNCWIWAGTALYEIMLSVNKGTKDRLSIQYPTSCKTYDTAERCACCGGDLGTLTNWYNSQGLVIPWSNTNASYVDGPRTCSDAYVCTATAASCESIAKDPKYAVDKFQAETIETTGVGQQQAIANIKNAVNQKKAVKYSFTLANTQDWNAFEHFWYNSDESVLWDPDKYCGKQHDPATGTAHATVLVGYNDDAADPAKHYWVILDSNGTADGKRPNGLFRIPMRMNYDCKLKQGTTSDFVTYFEVLSTKAGSALTLNLKGHGAGRVTSNPPGIDCSTSERTCTANFPDGETITLTAVPNKNSTFKGWTGGGCSGTGTCTIVLDDDTEIDDEFDSNCTYEIWPRSRTVSARGATFPVTVVAHDGDNCPSPEVLNTAPWITAKESAFSWNMGTVKVTVGPNETPDGRQTSLTIGDQELDVDQIGVVCRLGALVPASASVPWTGGQNKFIVQAQKGCGWVAAVDVAGTGWIAIDSGASGTGTGEVTYRVSANESATNRTGRITVTLTGAAGQGKKVFTVRQGKK